MTDFKAWGITMRRVSMFVPVLALALASATFGQSLGDVARQTRQKEKSNAKPAKKVITNEDIPESPDLNPAPPDTDGKKEAASPAASHHVELVLVYERLGDQRLRGEHPLAVTEITPRQRCS